MKTEKLNTIPSLTTLGTLNSRGITKYLNLVRSTLLIFLITLLYDNCLAQDIFVPKPSFQSLYNQKRITINDLNNSYNKSLNFNDFKDGYNFSGDSTKKKKHNRKLAGWMSAALPGLGQVYNKKYWKVPIIYAGAAAFGYFIIRYNGFYQQYHESYLYRMKVDTLGTDYFPQYSTDYISQNTEFYRSNLELTCILAGVWYLLNIVDAVVDAYLFDFNVSDDLSFRVEPNVNAYVYKQQIKPAGEVKLTMKFR